MRRDTPRTLLAAAVLAATLATAGCSAARDGGPAAAPRRQAATVGEPSDPTGWTLPLMAYLPTREQRRTLVRAERSLVGRCMTAFGLRWSPPADLPEVGPRNDMDWRYGIHDAALAATRGFQPDDGQIARYEAVLRAQDARPRLSHDAEVVLGGTGLPREALALAGPEVRSGTFHGKKIPEGGCFGQARNRLETATYGVSRSASELSGRSFLEAARDPAVRSVFTRWSACMKAEGFSYADPPALFDDPRFGRRPHPVTSLEIATARADLHCRAGLHVAEAWHTAEEHLQRQYIKDNHHALEAARHALARSLRAAARALPPPGAPPAHSPTGPPTTSGHPAGPRPGQ